MKRRKRPEPRHVDKYEDVRGKWRWRWRKTGFPTYHFSNPFGTPGFDEEYAACEAGAPIRAGEGRCIPRSVGDLVAQYYASANFRRGGADDQRRRRLLIESFRAEFANDLVANFNWRHIEAILTARAEKKPKGKRTVGGPVAAQNLRKQLRRLFAYAIRLDWISDNPVDEAERLSSYKTSGFHTWTEGEIAQFQVRHPIGTRARLALEIMLWTGQARVDACRFGPDQLKDGLVHYKRSKTGADLWLPAAPQLLEAIKAVQPRGLRTFLVNDYGRPFVPAGFGNKMREWCDQAGLPHCTAHGLRKAMARRLADHGATQQQIKAAGGWKRDEEVAIYTAAADQKRAAAASLGALAAQDLANRGNKLANPSGGLSEKKD